MGSGYDLDGLPPVPPAPAPRRRAPEYDLAMQPRRVALEYDLPPIDFRSAWDLDVLLQRAPVPEVEYAAWLRSLRALAAEAAGRDADLQQRLQGMLQVMESPVATVAFGGHFKTGKSTLLNAALGRRVLPSADLPETGTICVLRSGEADAVQVSDGRTRREIPCTLEAIQQETSLIGDAGERRTQVHRVEQLEITLADCGIPPQARWLDSPGINDTEEMNACALRAARQADVLAWVLSSKQPLSEVEMEFLAAYIAERGPTGVVFILNAFLQENTQEAWDAFLARKAPWILDKVNYRAGDLGFTPEAPPHVAPVSGLGLFGDSANDFGRTELRALLLGLGSPEVPRIRRARLGRIARDLRVLSDESVARQEQQRLALAQRKLEQEHAEREAAQRRDAFELALKQAVETFYGHWTTNVQHSAAHLVATINGVTLVRDDRYTHQLNTMLTQISVRMANGLLEEVRKISGVYGQPIPSPDQEAALRRLVTPPLAQITVANTPAAEVTAQTAARVDGAVRSVLQPLGIKVDPALGANLEAKLGSTFVSHRETPEKRERDAALTCAGIQAAVEQALAFLKAHRTEICALILGPAVKQTGEKNPLEVPSLSFRDARLETMLRLAEQAERLARQDTT